MEFFLTICRLVNKDSLIMNRQLYNDLSLVELGADY